VSSSSLRFLVILLLLPAAFVRSQERAAPSPQKADPHLLFRQGEAAFKAGNLDQSEHAFRGVLAINPQVAGGAPTWA
jgi:predicted TPR repeat methyltransferase